MYYYDKKMVSAIRESKEVGVKYMNAWEEEILILEKGREEGREEGLKEGIEKGHIETAVSMKRDGVSDEFISKHTGLSIEQIKNLHIDK